MNKVTKITCAVILIGLISTYGVLSGKSNSNIRVDAEQYAVLIYFPYIFTPYKIESEKYSVRVLYSGGKVENIKLTKEELAQGPMSSHVATILSRLSTEGYNLVSTNSVLSSAQGPSGMSIDTEVHCFLKKVK